MLDSVRGIRRSGCGARFFLLRIFKLTSNGVESVLMKGAAGASAYKPTIGLEIFTPLEALPLTGQAQNI